MKSIVLAATKVSRQKYFKEIICNGNKKEVDLKLMKKALVCKRKWPDNAFSKAIRMFSVPRTVKSKHATKSKYSTIAVDKGAILLHKIFSLAQFNYVISEVAKFPTLVIK